MATPPRSKADQRFELFLILLLWLFVGYLYLFAGWGVYFAELADGGGGGPGDSDNAQADVQRRAAAAEAALSPGTASAQYRKTVKVGQSFKVRLTICGAAAKDCRDSPSPTSHDSDYAIVVAPTKTGGHVYVELKSPDKEGLPEDLSGNGQKLLLVNGTKQWTWSLKAKRPGTYELTATIIVRFGESKEELDTTEVPPMTVKAEDTVSAWTARWAKRAGDFMNSLGGVLAAQFTAVVGFLVYRFNKRNSPPSSTTTSSPSTLSRTTPEAQAPPPRSSRPPTQRAPARGKPAGRGGAATRRRSR